MVSYSSDIVEDLSRRDFTVNAMAIHLPSGEFVDPHGGRRDLNDRVLRTPLAPEISFGEDPLRMLRAARFAAGYDLRPVAELEQSITRLRPRLAIVSVERVQAELERLLQVHDPTTGLKFLRRTGLWNEIMPELAAMHDGAWDAALSRVRRLQGVTRRLAGLLLELPVPTVGARLRALKFPSAEVARVEQALVACIAARALRSPDPAELRRYRHRAAQASEDGMALLWSFDAGRADQLRAAMDALAQVEDLAALRPLLDGDDVQSLLDVPPGPVVGQALAYLTELRLARGPLSRDEEAAAVHSWFARRD